MLHKTHLTLLALAGAALAFTWLPAWGDRQNQYIATGAILLSAGLLLLLFTIFSSRYERKTRVLIFICAAIAVSATIGLFRIEEVSGDLVPRLQFRWQGKPDEALPALAGPTGQFPETNNKSPELDSGETLTLSEFPQFLGPNRNGAIAGSGVGLDWNQAPPTEIWRRPVGAAWSSFAISGGRAVTQEQRGAEELVVCYWLQTGEIAWSHSDPARFQKVLGGIGPRATPAISNGRVYSLGATGLLNCLSLSDGKTIWSVNVIDQADCRNQEWGKSSSPLLINGLVVVSAGEGGCPGLIAYQSDSGKEAWRAAPSTPAYSSPVAATLNDREQILILNFHSVTSHDPGTGATLWTHPWEGNRPKVTQPVAVGNRVLLSSGYGVGAELLSIAEEPGGTFKVSSLWKNRNLKSKFANIVIHKNAAYGLDDGIMVAIDLSTGKRHWKGGRYGHGQLLLVDEKIIVLAENGDAVIVQPDTGGLIELSRHKMLTGKTWNHPALAPPYLLVRNAGEAACYRLKKVN